MRLKEYINEITQSPIKFIEKKVVDLLNNLKTNKAFFSMNDEEMIKQFNKYKNETGIEFIIHNTKKYEGKISKLINSAEFNADNFYKGIYARILLNKGFSIYFRRFYKENKINNFTNPNKNNFIEQLIHIISHEYIHTKQFIKSRGKSMPDDRSNNKNDEYKEYLSSSMEIESYAHDAAFEMLKYGKSKTLKKYSSYFDKNNKVYKKFLKKYNEYLTQMKIGNK